MMAVVAIGASGTFALADEALDSQTIDETVSGAGIYGHVEARVIDADGNIKAYTQGDNRIVNNGIDMIIFNTLDPSDNWAATGIDTTFGQVTHMQLGAGTTEVVAGTNTITAIATCDPDTFTGSAVGGAAAATLSAQFTTIDDGAGCAATIGEAGLFDGATGSGTDDMFAQNAFSTSVTLTTNDLLDVDWTFTFSDT